MHRFSVTLMAATLSELYASAAEFAAGHGASGPVQSGVSGGNINYGAAPTTDDNEDDAAPAADAPAFDGTGLPWDARIHSGNKAQNADKTWKRRRNTPDDTFAAVTAELRARVAGAPTSQPPGMPAAAPPAMQAGVNAAMGMPGMPAAAPPTTLAPGIAPMAMAAPPSDGMQFGEFMTKLSAAMQAGKFTPAELEAWRAMPEWNIVEIGHLQNDAAKTKRFHDWLAQYGKI